MQGMKIPLLVLILALFPAASSALTLAEAVQQALERHPNRQLVEASRHIESGYRRQADALLGGDPAVSVSATSDTFGSDYGYEEYVAGVSLPIWLPGQRSAKAAIAEGFAGLAEAQARQLAWEVSGAVLEKAWAVRIAQTEMKQAMKQWAAARALVQDVEHRFEVGELSRNDLLLAQQDLVEAETTYQEATAALEQARLDWFNYTGLHELPADLEAFAGATPPKAEGHPKLQAIQAAIEVAASKADDARAQRRAAPVVSLFAKRDRGSRHEEYTDSVGVEFSLPLGTRAPSAPAIAEAEAELTRAESEAALARRELDLQEAAADQELARATHLLQLAEKKYDYAHKRLRLAKRAFELGEMNLYQLLLARRQSNQATRDLKLRRLEKARAEARRQHVLGVIPQ